MDETGERVGNDESASDGHFGITGLRKKHIDIDGNKVTLTYIGKSGTAQEKSFSSEKIAAALKWAIKNSPQKEVFCTSDGFTIKSDRVNRYLTDFDVTAKDIRGYSVNNLIINKLKNITPAEEEKDRQKEFNKIAKSVAHKIGHGYATLKKHYMIPELENKFVKKSEIIDIKDVDSYKEGGKIDGEKGSEGGMVVGKRHSECDNKGCGEKFEVGGSGKVVELEGGEAVMGAASMQAEKKYEFEGKKMTGKQVASYLNHKGGGVKFANENTYKRGGSIHTVYRFKHGGELPSAIVKDINGGDTVITVKTMQSKDKYRFDGKELTPREILSEILPLYRRLQDKGRIEITTNPYYHPILPPILFVFLITPVIL